MPGPRRAAAWWSRSASPTSTSSRPTTSSPTAATCRSRALQRRNEAGRLKRACAAEVVARADDADLALLRVPAAAGQWTVMPICPADAIPAAKGDFPGLYHRLRRCRGAHRAGGRRRRQATRQKAGRRPRRWVWQVDRVPEKGRSGGPLIDHRGFLLGIASGASHGKGYYGHTEEIHRFLTRRGMKWLYADQGKP